MKQTNEIEINAAGIDSLLSETHPIEKIEEGQLNTLLERIYKNINTLESTKETLGKMLWRRILLNTDSRESLMKMFKCISLCTSETTKEIIEYFRIQLASEYTNPEEDFIWVNTLLQMCISIAQKSTARELMQTKEFFNSVQKQIRICPYKTIVLMIRLINNQLYTLPNQDVLEEILKESKGKLKGVTEVLFAYIEGYILRSMSITDEEVFERRLALPWDKKKIGHFPLQSLSLKILIDSLIQQRSLPFSFPALGFLAGSSRAILQYLEDIGDLQKIIKEALSATGTHRLKLEHFLCSILELKSNKTSILISEEGYIESIIKMLEGKLDTEIMDGIAYSGLTLLKLLTRSYSALSIHMCSYQMINTMEKLAVSFHRLLKKYSYPELTLSAVEYLRIIGNLVMQSRKWKEIAIQSIVKELPHYFTNPTLSAEALKVIKLLLFECKDNLAYSLYQALGKKEFFQKQFTTAEERKEFYGILKNILCLEEFILKHPLIIDLCIDTFLTTSKYSLEVHQTDTSLDQTEIELLSELIYCISNIAVILPEKVLTIDIMQTIIDLTYLSPVIINNFIWYLTNTLWNTKIPQELSTIIDISTELKLKKGIDQDIDKRISYIFSLITKHSEGQQSIPDCLG
ncbi:hypothetical protein NEOKW01_2023 [Nematocida sp. AWRm80]|nr:hypothetical protein NEOKW01_2023 [Nematocida sp. AWRm80]